VEQGGHVRSWAEELHLQGWVHALIGQALHRAGHRIRPNQNKSHGRLDLEPPECADQRVESLDLGDPADIDDLEGSICPSSGQRRKSMKVDLVLEY
jgi:hypothetical protein